MIAGNSATSTDPHFHPCLFKTCLPSFVLHLVITITMIPRLQTLSGPDVYHSYADSKALGEKHLVQSEDHQL